MIVVAGASAVMADDTGRTAGALAPRLDALRARLEVEKRESDHWVRPGATPVATPTVRETYVALADLQALDAADQLVDPFGSTNAAAVAIRLGEALLSVQAPARPARLELSNGLFKHAYFARNDNSPQPYWVACPGSGMAKRLYPLVVFLHGWLPDTTRRNPWYPLDNLVQLCRAHNSFLVAPHGRTNTDFQFAGEVDVLRVIEEMVRFYPVDPDRVYLTGVSMGGAGAWQIALHYPDRFAAVAPVSAQTDWFRFWHETFGYPVRPELPRHVAWIMAMHSPLELAQNSQNVYSYSQQSPYCFLGIAHGQGMAERLRALDIDHAFHADPDPERYGHHIYFQTDCWQRVLKEMLARTRVRTPHRFLYRSYSLRFPGTYWAQAWHMLKWGDPMSFEGRLESKGALRLKTENVKSLRLTPPAEWADANGAFRLDWNGVIHTNLSLGALGSVFVEQPGTTRNTDFPYSKSPGVCGPASDVFNFPFIVVVGTSGTDQETAANQRLADQFVSDWGGYAEGTARVIRDVELTREQEAKYGLVLVGLPENHCVLRAIAGQLPLKLSRAGVALPDGKVFERDNLGVLLTYPNPRAPCRYILVYSGIAWGEGRSKNHRFDFIPDFALYSHETIPALGINRFLAAGLFDENWHYDETLTDFAAGDVPAGPSSKLRTHEDVDTDHL